jgi:hypothetical protein
MDGMANLDQLLSKLKDRVRKIMVILSFNVVKPPGFNFDAVGIVFPSAPFPELAEQAPAHEIE